MIDPGQAQADWFLQQNAQANTPVPGMVRMPKPMATPLRLPPTAVPPTGQPAPGQPGAQQGMGGIFDRYVSRVTPSMGGLFGRFMPEGGGLMDFNKLAYRMARPTAQMPYSSAIMNIFNRGLPALPSNEAPTPGRRSLISRLNDPLGLAPGYGDRDPNVAESLLDPAGWFGGL